MPEELWRRFHDWVEGVGPRPEDGPPSPELPPDLPFARRPQERRSRFHELTVRERWDAWIDGHGHRLFTSLYAGTGIVACALLAAVLLSVVSALPPFGEPGNPVDNEVLHRYVERGGTETGARNIVAAMILDYRAFDTFGESAVLFTAAASVLMILGASRRGRSDEGAGPAPHLRDACQLQRGPPRLDDDVLRGVAAVAVSAILMIGATVAINGHLSPGGGFAGGTILSGALILAACAWGPGHVRRLVTERSFLTVSCGALLLYALMKGWSFFAGANYVSSSVPTGELGDILSGGLILPLDICVGLIVAGTLYVLYALFSEGEV